LLFMRKVRFGIIGCGRISDLHALGYRNYDRAEIIAVSDTVEGRVREKASLWGARRWYLDYRQLLKDDEVDAVEILTPHYLHKQMAIEAAEAGKHVSVQKPMAITVSECEEMIQAARRAGVKLQVFEDYIFYPPLAKAKELLDAGMIGEPCAIRLKVASGYTNLGWAVGEDTKAWRSDPQKSGGLNHHHQYALAKHMLGEVGKVSALLPDFEGHPESGMIIWTYREGGRYGVLEMTEQPRLLIESRYYADDERVEISGKAGYIWVNRCTGKLLKVAPLVIYRDGETTHFGKLEEEWETGFINTSHHFVDCILEDKKPLFDGEEGKKTLQFVMASYQSAITGRVIDPSEMI